MGVFDDLLEQDAKARATPDLPAQATAPAVRPSVFSDLGDPNPVKPTPRPAYHGAVLPFTRDSEGNVSFDPLNAGPGGQIKQAVTLPGRVLSGETQMPSTFDPRAKDPRAAPMIGEVLNLGGTFGPMNPAVRAGDKIIPGVATRPADMGRAVTPSSADLLKKGGEQHNAFRDMPIAYDPKYMGTLADQIKNKLVKEGVNEEDSPNLYKTIDRMYNYVPKSDDPTAQILLTPGGLITLRKSIATKFEQAGENKKGVSAALEEINKFLEAPPKNAVLAGPAAEGGAIYKAGRENYAAGKRAAGLEDIRYTADLRTGAAHSGLNPDNTLRGRVASHILNAKKIRGYDPEEIAMLEAIPTGTVPRNAMRYVGGLMGGGGGLGAGVAGGLTTTGAMAMGIPPGGAMAIGSAVPAVGAALKLGAGRGSEQALLAAEQAVRQRSPLFREQVKSQDIIPPLQGRDAIAASMLRQSMRPAPQPQPPFIERYDPENYL